MIKSNFIKLIMLFLLITLLINIFYIPTSHAIGNIMQSGKDFLAAADSDNPINTTNLENTSKYLYNVLLAIGIVVAVIVAMVLGIQFMTASAGEKAKVKEALIPFVAGCIIVFGAFTIWKVAVTIGTNAENSTKSEFEIWYEEEGDIVKSKYLTCDKEIPNKTLNEILSYFYEWLSLNNSSGKNIYDINDINQLLEEKGELFIVMKNGATGETIINFADKTWTIN